MNELRKTLFRVDAKAVSKRYFNDAGFLVLPECTLARSGTLEYSEVEDENGDMLANGELITVYRTPEAVKEATKSFANLPLTLQHPDGDLVDTNNAKEVVVGALGSDPRFEMRGKDAFVICDIIVYDKDAIAAIENNEAVELSAGITTAFRKKRGIAPDGKAYEAVQFLLIPNHVALVNQGRCGHECKVCDGAEKQKGVKSMKTKKGTRAEYRLVLGDGTESIPLTEEQVEALKAEDPNIEIEEEAETEMDEDENLEELETETEVEPDEDEEIEEEEEIVDEDEDLEEETEEEIVDEDEEIVDEDEDGEAKDELIYEVQFDDGTIGRMDEAAYRKVSRFLEVSKKGDRAEKAVAQLAVITSQATKVLGDSFDIAKYAKGDGIDVERIKKAVIKKCHPSLVTTALKGDALDRVYRMALESHKKNSGSWENDVRALTAGVRSRVGDSDNESMVAKARKRYLVRQSGLKK